jgi:hypothetical protein
VPKGTDQVAEAAEVCRSALAALDGGSAPDDTRAALAGRLEAAVGRLEALQPKFFLRMAPSLRYTAACLDAARGVQAAVAEAAAEGELSSRLDALEAATATLESRANAAGNMTIT